MNKILITGSGGFIGKNLFISLKGAFNVIGVSKSKGETVDHVLDLSDKQKLAEILNLELPKVIIHNAAYSNVEGCEADKDKANVNNVQAVKNITDWASQNNARVIFISTDYVYDGSKGNFTEADLEHPIQYYGQTKLEGEQLVNKLKNYVILRTTVVYGWDETGKNFFMQMYRSQKNKQTISVPVDQVSNPTSVVDLVAAIKRVVIDFPDISGTYITTGPEAMSRFEFASHICGYFNWDKNLIEQKLTSELGQLAKRPLNNSTVNTKFCEIFNFKFRSLNENLAEMKKFIK
jgi:dTDP-4-dehydrorhamnose reductase